MHAQRIELPGAGTDHRLGVIRHGHWGRPVLVFPSEAGRAEDFGDHGMVAAVQHLVDQGRVELLLRRLGRRDGRGRTQRPIEERARRHATYDGWLEQSVVPWIAEQVGHRRTS